LLHRHQRRRVHIDTSLPRRECFAGIHILIRQGLPLMQLVAPDILSDACGLSIGLVIAGVVLGLALWLFGWSCHRFWIVLITTVLAGVYGLYDAAAFRAQPLVAALLLALVGGLLALALVR